MKCSQLFTNLNESVPYFPWVHLSPKKQIWFCGGSTAKRLFDSNGPECFSLPASRRAMFFWWYETDIFLSSNRYSCWKMRLHPWDLKAASCSSLECSVMFSSTCEAKTARNSWMLSTGCHSNKSSTQDWAQMRPLDILSTETLTMMDFKNIHTDRLPQIVQKLQRWKLTCYYYYYYCYY